MVFLEYETGSFCGFGSFRRCFQLLGSGGIWWDLGIFFLFQGLLGWIRANHGGLGCSGRAIFAVSFITPTATSTTQTKNAGLLKRRSLNFRAFYDVWMLETVVHHVHLQQELLSYGLKDVVFIPNENIFVYPPWGEMLNIFQYFPVGGWDSGHLSTIINHI